MTAAAATASNGNDVVFFVCVLYTLWFIRLVFGAAAAVVVTTAVYTQPYTYWNIVVLVCFFFL